MGFYCFNWLFVIFDSTSGVHFNNTEDYVNTAGLLMLPAARLGQYGYKPQAGRVSGFL